MKKITNELLLLVAVALWGSSFALTKPLLSEMGVFTFMAFRFLFGGLILVVVLLIIGRFKLTVRQIKGGLITGTLLFLAFIFHTYGLKYTTVSKNAFIVGSNVIFVPVIMTLFRKERQPRQVWLSTFLALIGLGMVTLDGIQGGINLGDFITLIGTVIVAFYILTVEKYVRSENPINIATVQVLTVGLFSLVPAVLFETPSLQLSQIAIRNLLILSIGCTSVAYLIANYCQRVVSASRTSLLYVFEPIFGAFLGWLLLGEQFGAQGIIGAIIITTATLLPVFLRQKSLPV